MNYIYARKTHSTLADEEDALKEYDVLNYLIIKPSVLLR